LDARRSVQRFREHPASGLLESKAFGRPAIPVHLNPLRSGKSD
jgi:hypothetical protein